MKLTAFKRRVLNKMFIDMDDANSYQYLEKIVPTLNECLVLVANSHIPLVKEISLTIDDSLVAILPDEVIMIDYMESPHKNADFFQPTQKSVRVNLPGEYKFICDCLYPEILDDVDDDSDVLPEIPESIAAAAVFYVASELMRDIDLTTAITIRNQFEMFIAQLEIQMTAETQSFNVKGRW